MSLSSHTTTPPVAIRPMTPADWPLLRALRLTALADTPTAFYANLATERAMTDAQWQERATAWSTPPTCQTFLALDATDTPVGLAATIRDRADPHTAVLISMWVHPTARRHGTGKALVTQTVAWSRQHRYHHYTFEVTSTNARARAFYESQGFQYTGIDSVHPTYPDLPMLGMTLPLRTRQMRAEEWQLYRDLRLAALQDTPTAYGWTYANAVTLTEQEWRDRTLTRTNPDNFTTIIALSPDNKPVGLASGTLDKDNPAHADLISMWIAPAHRATGLGAAVIQNILAWATKKNCTHLHLGVTEGNLPALRLYERQGFQLTGESKQSESHPHLQILSMSRPLP